MLYIEILGLQPRDKVAMLVVRWFNTIEFFSKNLYENRV